MPYTAWSNNFVLISLYKTFQLSLLRASEWNVRGSVLISVCVELKGLKQYVLSNDNSNLCADVVNLEEAFSNFERATHAPMMIHIAGLTNYGLIGARVPTTVLTGQTDTKRR
ncbi:hypothetical protein DPMN_022849 [Dreissena polymorpha]|uniref:Uncharacterized protein n=1 Tax=Dreissena polymorpha TaxID=45954 RepID=A0A9D4NL19_DREPO|nr:hypothetical protein DPMN_022849 [Dreissena polymorpha]